MSAKSEPDDSSADLSTESENERACGIVNPASGLASEFLNVFNEIVLALEFLPTMPEMKDEVLAWQPHSYCDYFKQSTLPGAKHALEAYERVDPVLRAGFESVQVRLNEIVTCTQQKVAEAAEHSEYPDSIVKACEQAAETMRIGVSYLNWLINEGDAIKAAATNIECFNKEEI